MKYSLKQYLLKKLERKVRRNLENGNIYKALTLSNTPASERSMDDQELIHKMNKLQYQFNEAYQQVNPDEVEKKKQN